MTMFKSKTFGKLFKRTRKHADCCACGACAALSGWCKEDDDEALKAEEEQERLNPTPREQKLTSIILDTFWMARRYANGRKTYAPATINHAITALKALGIDIPDDHTLVADGNSNAEYLDVTFQ